MNMKKIACGLIAASLGFSTLSFAQPSRHEEHREARHDMREARHEMRDARHDLREAREERREAHYFHNARGPEFRRGGHLPRELRDRHYVVTDWRHHHLAAPPRGYQWVQVGPDFVLAAIATGVILNLVVSQ